MSNTSNTICQVKANVTLNIPLNCATLTNAQIQQILASVNDNLNALFNVSINATMSSNVTAKVMSHDAMLKQQLAL